MDIPAQVAALVTRFQDNSTEYHSSVYNETQVRREFIDPFFIALGWDVENTRGYPVAYKDVIHEDAIKIEGAPKKPDYSFRMGGARKFFVEAKRPSVHLRDHAETAFQLRRYGWSAKLPVSVVTNFAEFAVYDCRVKPDRADSAATARILYLTCDQYAARWGEIDQLFSYEGVLAGFLDAYAQEEKRGTATVDAAFLKEIEEWRDMLARDIAFRNPQLSQRELNYAVQMTIDRIVFLRICEDRGIERYGRLHELQANTGIYERLCDLYKLADDRYNSGLFHFRREHDRQEDPDDLTLHLTIDDDWLAHIIKHLYYPDSPYEFSVLSADILGQVYEQFLGKVIRVSPGRVVEIEEKPEVRKAGGVYYTPTYVVDYIVKQTVGKLVEGKTPQAISGIRILDPACGSGSFLIGAYQYLLDWYLGQYMEAGARVQKAMLHTLPDGTVRLNTSERKRILLEHIFGVDIDPQAAEVTKLSLLLKVLEGETDQAIAMQLTLLHERALPDLSANIKCGNSLIGPDYYLGQQLNLFDEEQRFRVNDFDWNDEFPHILRNWGGFDVIIGNPPYIFTRNQGIDEQQKAYFYRYYLHQSAQLNTFGLFVERCHTLLRAHGRLGFITPNNWLTIDTFAPLRAFVLTSAGNLKIVNILDKVFSQAQVDTAIVLFEKGPPTELTVAEMRDGAETFTLQVSPSILQPPAYIVQISLLKDPRLQRLVQSIETCSRPLETFCTVSTGLKAYQTGKGRPPQTDYQKMHRVFHATEQRDDTYGRYLDGEDVRRYILGWSGEYLSYGDWLAEPRRSVPFAGERLLVRQIPARPPYLIHAVFTDEAAYNDINSMVVFLPSSGVSLKYLLGLINSLLLSAWFRARFDKLQRSIFPQFKVKELASFPIRPIDLSSPKDRTIHDQLVALVDQMLSLNQQATRTTNPQDKVMLHRHIEGTNRQIDQLVYDLYGLTSDDIALVEAIRTNQ